jgi:PAS domain S-box-containing protein
MLKMTRSSVGLALLVAVLVGATAWLGIRLTIELDRVAAIWLCNGLLVAVLLQRPRAEWLLLIGTSFVANLLVNLQFHDTLPTALGLSLANMLEVVIAAVMVRRSLDTSVDPLERRNLGQFVLYAIVVAPLVASILAAAILKKGTFDSSYLRSVASWWASDGLGMGIVVPLVLAIRSRELRAVTRNRSVLSVLAPFLLLIVVASLVFFQNTYPLLFLLMPPLLLIAFRFGFSGTAIAISLTATLALSCTLIGRGPFMLIEQTDFPVRIVAMQVLFATLILTTYPVCAVIASQRRLLKTVAANEERFRVIAATSSDIIALTDSSGIWKYLSPAVTTLFGWTPEELIGRNGLDFVHEEDRQLYIRGTHALRGGRDVLSGMFRMRHRDGQYIWVETISRVLRDATTGHPTGWVSNTRDISSRKRVEQMKDEFVSTVNHELRTPLTAILASIGLATSGRFGTLDAGLQKLLGIAKTNGDRLASLVNDILDFEKASSGKMRFDLQPHAIDELIDRSLSDIRPYAERLNVTIVRGQRAAGVLIDVDIDRFQQIMANLLSNAAKFSKPGGEVRIETATSQGNCRVSVIDHGCGIAEAFRASLFERFVQADSSDGRAKGGTGLGMAIAKRLTEGMNGRISFNSKENVGTTFVLDFPLSRDIR